MSAESALYIFSDQAKDPGSVDAERVRAVRECIRSIEGFREVVVHEQSKNLGLAASIISGLNMVFEKHERVIVMEDDILVSADFLQFMNTALRRFESDKRIGSVSGYSYQLEDFEDEAAYYLVKRASSWGWGTWKNRWDKVDWQVSDFEYFIGNSQARYKFMDAGADQLPMLVKQQRGIIDSWAIRWTYHHFKHQLYCLVPKYSKVKNIGTDGSGTNFVRKTLKFETELNESLADFPAEIGCDKMVDAFIRKRYSPSLYRRIINFLKYRVW